MKVVNRTRKLAGMMILALCAVIAIIFNVVQVKAEEPAEKQVMYESREYKGKEESQIPKKTGYLFAGWYESEEETTPVMDPKLDETYFAKFVPEEVLDIKAQVSQTLIEGKEATGESIRFITSIDSTSYNKIGFMIDKGKGEKEANVTNKVYQKLYAIDSSGSVGTVINEVFPTIFHATSAFFKTYTINKIPGSAYDTDITIRPYWVTLDGTRVYGTKAIKTVNLGRSWVYIDAAANEDGMTCGTKDHPHTSFADALNAVLVKNGKITIKENGKIQVPETFTWKEREKGKEVGKIIITGENSSSTLDFSLVKDMEINDDVTFAKMTLKLNQGDSFATSEKVFLNGHRFIIGEDVVSHNPCTIIYGGGYQKDVDSTYVEIHAGRYCCIYGGGLEGNVQKDTNVVLENTDVYSPNSAVARVHGGGESATVFGDAHVTLGDGFNSDSEFDITSHSKLSSVYGGGYSKNQNKRAIVAGDTYVTVKGTARFNYSFGGGYNYSDVQGRCHTNFEGGTAVSIYGGSFASGSGKNGDPKNPHATVVMTGGTVEQIYGGNEYNEMAGDTSVQILGGTVKRRIYGGCYNNYSGGWKTAISVAGNTNVTIGPDAKILQEAGLLEGDTSVCAISRLGENKETETGVMVLNANTSSVKLGFQQMTGVSKCAELYTNYLVNVEEGGLVTAENRILQITPNDGHQYATVKKGEKVLCVVEGKGTYQLPELADSERTSIQNITVTFSNEKPVTTNFAVKSILGDNIVYYDSLESAVAAAEDNTTIVLLKDVTVNSSMTVSKSVTLTSESAVTITRGDAFTNGSMFDITGIFKVQGSSEARITIDGNASEDTTLNVRGFYVHSGKMFELKYATVKNFRTTGDGGAVRVTESSIADVQNSEFTGNLAQVGGAIHILEGVKVTNKNSVFTNNESTGNGGAVYCGGTYEDTNSSYTNNKGAKGGALIVMKTGNATLSGDDEKAKFKNNEAKTSNADKGYAIYSQGNTTVKGYTFEEENQIQTIMAVGTLTFDNITGAILKQGPNGKIYVAGYDSARDITITPKTYARDTVVLEKAKADDGTVLVTDDVFEAACAGIKVTPDSTGNKWCIGKEGKLARIWEANNATELNNAHTSATAGDVIYVMQDMTISATQNVSKDITITNEPGKTITITGSGTAVMFKVNSGSLTLGTNNPNETGKLTVNGNAYKQRLVDNQKAGIFTLGKNTTLQRGGNATWGGALINRGTANLYGTVQDNQSGNVGGALLQYEEGVINIYGGTYTSNTNKVTDEKNAKGGAVIVLRNGTVNIMGGTFQNNKAEKGSGGVVYVYKNQHLNISGGTFAGNSADKYGNAVYVESDATVTISGGTFAGNIAQEIYVEEGGILTVSKGASIEGTYYDTLTEALAEAKAGETICIWNDAELSETVSIDKNITLTSARAVTITKSATLATNMFNVTAGTFSIEGTDLAPITLNGNKSASGYENARAINLGNGTALNLKHVTIENFKTIAEGGAIYVADKLKGTIDIQNCHFIGNQARVGGAMSIRGKSATDSSKVTCINSIFESNQSDNTTNGGAINIANTTYNDTNSSYIENTATSNGGAIIAQSGANITLKGTDTSRAVFKNNSKAAGKNGSAIFINTGATATITGYTFTNDEGKEEQTIHVAGTLNYKDLIGITDGTFTGTGKKNLLTD